MGSIAFAHGHFWKTLWELPANADLKRARRHPHILLPGDRVTVPPLRRRDERCATGARHVFRRKGVPAQVRFVMKDVEGKPFAGKRYELTLGRRITSGQTDGEGRIEAWVDPAEHTGELTVWLDTPGYPEMVRHPLRIGDLEPIESLRGAAARLNALGYPAGRVGDEPSDGLRAGDRVVSIGERDRVDG
jgi:N-acetylmuramoyl-L-alanine amidase